MKKIYIMPAVTVTHVAVSRIIASSPLGEFNQKMGDTSTEGVDGSAALTKQQNYDVWNDDWSK